MKYLIVLCSFFIAIAGNSQRQPGAYYQPTSFVITSVAEGWKKDSIGKSGNPRKDYVGFIYYVVCENDYPKDKWFWGGYIEFVFDESESFLIYIDDGEFCG